MAGAQSSADVPQRLCLQLQAWTESIPDSRQHKDHEALRRALEAFTHSHDQVSDALQQPLVDALAAVCDSELHAAAAGANATVPQQPAQAAAAPGTATAAAHSELLRLCVAALGRAASTASGGKSTASKLPGKAANISRNAESFGDAAGAAAAAAQRAVRALVYVLEACVGGGARPLADPIASGFYSTLTKALRLLMPDAVQEQHVTPLVECLRKFLRYGIQPEGLSGSGIGSLALRGATARPTATPPLLPQGGQAARAYRPPQRRATSLKGWSDSDSASDSDCSSDGGGSGGADGLRGGRVRRGALSVLAAAAAAAARAVHCHWAALLPRAPAAAAHAAVAPTLADALLYDPQPQVRAAAAVAIGALLESPASRAYLGIAEVRPAARQPARGFTPLSELLGQLATATHDALLQAAAAPASTAAKWQSGTTAGSSCVGGNSVGSSGGGGGGGSIAANGSGYVNGPAGSSFRPPAGSGFGGLKSLPAAQPPHNTAVQAAALRALAAFMAAAPLQRLPPELLPRCIEVLHGALLADADSGRAADPAVELAALQCLAAALSTQTASAAMEKLLAQQQSSTAAGSNGGPTKSAMALPAALQRPPAAKPGQPVSVAAAKLGEQLDGQLPRQHRRSDVASWRGPAGNGAAPRPTPAAGSLADLLLDTATGPPGTSSIAAWAVLAALATACWPVVLLHSDRLLEAAARPLQGGPYFGASGSGPAAEAAAAQAARAVVQLLAAVAQSCGAGRQSGGTAAGSAIATSLGAAVRDGRPGSPAAASSRPAAAAEAPAAMPAGQAALLWQAAADRVLFPALLHRIPALQAAALSGLAALSDETHAALPADRQRRLWAAVSGVLSSPAASAAVRAAAAKAVGGLAALPSFVESQTDTADDSAATVLGGAICSGHLAAAATAAASLATYCDTLHLSSAAAGSRAAGERPATDCTANGGVSLAGGTGAATPLSHATWLHLLSSAIVAARHTSDKVACHGERAIGHLLVIHTPSGPSDIKVNGAVVQQALQALTAALGSTSAKAQWNAAAAAARVFGAAGGPVAATELGVGALVAEQLPQLLAACATALQHSTNSKAQMQAAAALAAAAGLPPGALPLNALRSALQAVRAAQGHNSGSSGGGGGGGGGDDNNGIAAAATGGVAASIELLVAQPASSAEGNRGRQPSEGPGIASIDLQSPGSEPPTAAELRYRAGLAAQLEAARCALEAAVRA